MVVSQFNDPTTSRAPVGIAQRARVGIAQRAHVGVLSALAAALAAAGLAVPAAGQPVTAAAAPAASAAEATTTTASSNAQQQRFTDRVVTLLNADRARMGLRPLQRDPDLDAVATGWSRVMASERRVDHNPRYTAQYPPGWLLAGENVAAGYSTADALYRGWYSSPGHYANMTHASFTHIGVGIAYASNGTLYATQNFAQYRGGPSGFPDAVPADDGSSTRGIDDGGIGGSGDTFYLNDTFSAYANTVLGFGNVRGRFYVGDWDGDGRDTLAYRIGRTFYIANRNTDRPPVEVIHYGRPGDRVYVGDWNGDGRDTFAVRRGQEYHVKNSLQGGAADRVVRYGRATDQVLVGDWNGDRRDTFAVRRGNTYFVKNTIAGGDADRVITYGRPNDLVYVGDWNGSGRDSFAVRRDRTYHIAYRIRGGAADIALTYGRADDTTLVGDWNGDGKDTLGVRRP